MTFREIVRFEMAYQLRRWTWIYLALPPLVNLLITIDAYTSYLTPYRFNSPLIVAGMTLIATVTGLLATSALAGEAAARDVQTRTHPFFYTSGISERNYLVGRFTAAFVLIALQMLAVEILLLLSAVVPGAPAELIGPIQPTAYFAAYFLIGLPNAFIGTALLFSIAALCRRPIASFIGVALMALMVVIVFPFMLDGQTELAQNFEPFGLIAFTDMALKLAVDQYDTFSIVTHAPLLWHRLIWVSIAMVILLVTCYWFRFQHVTTGASRRSNTAPVPVESARVRLGDVPQSFGFTTQVRQMFAVAVRAVRQIALSWGGLAIVALATMTLLLEMPTRHGLLGLPLFPTTPFMAAVVGTTGRAVWMLVRLFTLYYVGELVWRERENGLNEISDASPTPEWVRLVGRLLGFVFAFVGLQALMLAVCLVIQALFGYSNFEIGLYARILFGLQLAEYLLFLMMAFAVHVIVNQKYFGHIVVVLFSVLQRVFNRSGVFGIEHKLLVFGSNSGWTYSDMRGFEPTLPAWTWFTVYWAAWAVMLGVLATLFWIRGRDTNLTARIRAARLRLRGSVLGIAATAAVLIVIAGSFIFYNTNVLNANIEPGESGDAVRRI